MKDKDKKFKQQITQALNSKGYKLISFTIKSQYYHIAAKEFPATANIETQKTTVDKRNKDNKMAFIFHINNHLKTSESGVRYLKLLALQ